MAIALFIGWLSSPLIALFGGLFRALLLFWPTMILLGAAHSHLDYIPALGWKATFWVVALLGVLVPTSSSRTVSK